MSLHELETQLRPIFLAALAGDAAAYRLFLDTITVRLRGYLRQMLARAGRSEPSEAEDVLQETLLALHLARHTYDAASPVTAWAHAIARYKLADAFRRRRTAIHLPIEDWQDQLAAPEADPGAARDSAALIGRLDARSAAIVRAVSLDGESAAEVGQRLEMSEGAVRVTLHRAMRRMMRIAKGEPE